MVDESDCEKRNSTIRNLYPDLTEEELLAADKTLGAYLELVLRIYNRIYEDPEAYAKFKEMLAAEKERKPE